MSRSHFSAGLRSGPYRPWSVSSVVRNVWRSFLLDVVAVGVGRVFVLVFVGFSVSFFNVVSLDVHFFVWAGREFKFYH